MPETLTFGCAGDGGRGDRLLAAVLRRNGAGIGVEPHETRAPGD